MKKLRKSIIILTILLVSSCAANYKKIADKTTKVGLENGLRQKTYQTKNFQIYTLQRITDVNKKVRIYFEGDGKAYIKKNVISPNPTPTSYFLVNLLAEDDSPNLIYIARPCQFVKDEKCYNNHPERYWTSAKFSKEVIEAMNEVTKNFSEFKLELVGYSDSATIAKYVAAENQKNYQNVINLRTIAGNLDNKKLSQINKAAIDDYIVNEASTLKTLAKIPQIHFIGKEDAVIPGIISKSYLQSLPKKNCIKIITVPATTHSSGWQENWVELLKIQPFCQKEIKHKKKVKHQKKPQKKCINVSIKE